MKSDLRVQKTLQRIHDSFFQCILRTPFSKITINDITSTALVNKTTFYAHYKDKYDLRQRLVEETLAEFRNNINLSFVNMNHEDADRYAKDVQVPLLSIFQNREKFKLLWHPNLECDVSAQMQLAFEKHLRMILKNRQFLHQDQMLSPKDELFVRLFAGNAMCTIRWWLEYCPEMPLEEVAETITACIVNGEMKTFLMEE